MFKRIAILSVLIILLTACGQSERNAKSTVEEYLDLMMVGNVSESLNLLDSTDGFIDVFNYEFLDVIGEREVEDKFTMFRSDFEDSIVWKEEYEEWDNFYEHMYSTFGQDDNYEFNGDSDLYLEYWEKGDTFKEYTLLYDMEIANGLGNKLFKKVEFTTTWDKFVWDGENHSERFVITDINIR